MIDGIDAKILDILQSNSRTPVAEVARRLGMAPSAIFGRIRKLEERGVIQGYGVRLDPRVVNLGLLAFVFVRTADPVGGLRTARLIAKIPEVQEVHHIVGEDCLLVKVRAADTEDLGRLLREKLGTIESVESTRTTVVMETVKETEEIPLTRAARKSRGG